jgi:arylsulfatase A-like enzyme
MGRLFLALGLLLAVACGRGETPRLSVQVRLVDPEARRMARVEPGELVTRDLASYPIQTSAVAQLPRATIDDDTRPVLASFERVRLAFLAPVQITRYGRIHAELQLQDAFVGAETVVVMSDVRPTGREDWLTVGPTLVPIETRPEGRVLVLDVAVDAGAAGAPAQLNAIGLRASGTATRYDSAPLPIPAGARLELSLGVLAAAAAQGPVRFSLDACEDERCSSLLSEVLDPASAAGRVWNDRQLDLSALAGTTRALRFRTEQLPGGGAFTLPVWGDPVLLAPAAAPDPRPNLILLSIDTLRRDHLDAYGYFRETAPFLRERLAGEGVTFDGLVAEAATTDPSHMTMFTSLPARVHGVTRELLPLGVPATTLAAELRRHGYRTAAITEDGPLAHDRGFEIGFDAYRENKSTNLMLPAGRVEDTFRQARDWLERNGDRPFFLFLHTFQVHAPYEPPAVYRTLFAEAEPAVRTLAQRRTIADYDREIRYVDDQLAELVRFADRRGHARDTIWVVLSDHGEEFWEHGSLGHGTLPYEEVLRVPLIVSGPGVARGVRRTEALHHLDLMPTLLELAGAPVPQQAQGRSFAPLLPSGGSAATAWPPRPLASAAWMLPASFEPPALALRLGNAKLMRVRDRSGWREQSFDLAADPHEQHPRPGAVPALRAALEAHERAAEALRASLAASAHAPEPSPVLLDPERERTLRALGYIE